MDAQTKRVYDRYRKQGHGARDSLSLARMTSRSLEYDWDHSYGAEVATATFEHEGFDVKVKVDYEQYVSSFPEPTEDDTGIRNPRFKWTGDSWDTRHTERYLTLESGNTVRELAEYYNKAGQAKHAAWEAARISLNEEAEAYFRDDYAQYVIGVEVSFDGVVVGQADVGGVELDDEQSTEAGVEDIVRQDGLLDEAMSEAREALAEHDSKIHASGLLTA